MTAIRTRHGGPPRWHRRAVLALTVWVVVVAWQPAADAAVDKSAQEFIQRLGNQTLSILDQKTAAQDRLQDLKQLLDQSTDLELISRLVLGRYWKQADAGQQAEFVHLFKELVMQTMAERFSWYTGETMERYLDSALLNCRRLHEDKSPYYLVEDAS